VGDEVEVVTAVDEGEVQGGQPGEVEAAGVGGD